MSARALRIGKVSVAVQTAQYAWIEADGTMHCHYPKRVALRAMRRYGGTVKLGNVVIANVQPRESNDATGTAPARVAGTGADFSSCTRASEPYIAPDPDLTVALQASLARVGNPVSPVSAEPAPDPRPALDRIALEAEGCDCEWDYQGDERAGEPGMVRKTCRRCRDLEAL